MAAKFCRVAVSARSNPISDVAHATARNGVRSAGGMLASRLE
eukprot:CAMPEP_0197887058 /NCGR_PEP_ID=MMETSP1439-20131203/18962_1 /TAXON_ID=66791 /ORGANISM="Gonyaulax spinifera, Strain CCMP409" /LENGTH=41 /DNA_ID= /DNA_START= /DNA_END= /DNA_ORIENTATION=